MCDCNTKMNEQLAAHNTILDTPWYPPELQGVTFVRTDKLETGKRGKPISVLATFCPFCGEKYAKAEPPPCEVEMSGEIA